MFVYNVVVWAVWFLPVLRLWVIHRWVVLWRRQHNSRGAQAVCFLNHVKQFPRVADPLYMCKYEKNQGPGVQYHKQHIFFSVWKVKGCVVCVLQRIFKYRGNVNNTKHLNCLQYKATCLGVCILAYIEPWCPKAKKASSGARLLELL